uniref:telomere repeats-binding bouquet formation protein 1 isoform X2 n=1 Tax=Myxine glutinosa TaxID=7769 RepID=UPI00358F702A
MNQLTRNHSKRFCKTEHMAEETSPDPAISHEVQVDLALLIECLKFQTGESSYQKQALGTIGDICAHNVAACEYMCESGGLKFLMEMSSSLCCLEVKETIMYTLGVLAESSVLCQQVLCSSELLAHCTSQLLATATVPTRLRCSSAYLLLSLFSNNRAGQTLANSSNCLNILLAVYREGISCLVGGGGGDCAGSDGHSSIAPQLWTMVASILAASANNPQNEVNQWACASAFPATVDLLHSTMVSGVLRTLCTFLCAIISNNGQCQTALVRAGGLEALAQLLTQLSDVAQSDDKAAQLAIYVAQTLDNCISLNASIAKQVTQYGVVSNLLHLLRDCNPDPANKLSLLLTIGHCTENCASMFPEPCLGVNTQQHLQEEKQQKEHQLQLNQQQQTKVNDDLPKDRMLNSTSTIVPTCSQTRPSMGCMASHAVAITSHKGMTFRSFSKPLKITKATSAVPGSVDLAKPKFKIAGRRAINFPKACSSVSINTSRKKGSGKQETPWLGISKENIDVNPMHICREEIEQEITRHRRKLSICCSSTRCLACSANGFLLNSINFVSTLMNCNSTCDLHRKLLEIERASCRKIAAHHVSRAAFVQPRKN